MNCQVCYDAGEVRGIPVEVSLRNFLEGVEDDEAVWAHAVIVPCPACSGQMPEAPSTPGLVEGGGPGRASANTGPPPDGAP